MTRRTSRWMIVVLVGSVVFGSGRIDAAAPPDTPFTQAVATCKEDPLVSNPPGGPIGSAFVDRIILIDDGHSLIVDASSDSGIGVGCVLRALGLPAWPRQGFPGWVTIDGYTLTWTASSLGGQKMIFLDEQVAPDATG